MLRHVRTCLFAGAALAAHPAFAADALKFGAAPPWVHPQTIPIAVGGSADAPVALLLTDQQSQIQPGKLVSYSEVAMKIQRPQGLAAGNISIPWDPATDTVTVNKLEIHRGTQVIDVLAAGQKFTTMRREAGLEEATLDGILTANIQPEGLQEGDIIDLATTTEHSDPVMGTHVEANFAEWPAMPIGRAHARLEWPSSLNLKLQSKGVAAQPVTRGGTKILEITSTDVQPIMAPKGAPPRFAITRLGEVTDFAFWADVSHLIAPLFRKAETTPASGPLHDEVEKIRAATSDPKARAALALQLVQDRVRYVALVMGQGGYIPADAETTWSRRFGDCKAKTALLLGILHSFGIEAEPLLVQTKIGDAITERLPLVSYFDHVLVRANIGGKTYYLDGTRTGDNDLDRILVPDFGWALPLVDNARLVELVPPPLKRPQFESTVSIDATAGIYTPASVSIDQVIRGDLAVALNAGLAALTDAQRREYFDNYWKKNVDDLSPGSTSSTFDKAAGQLHLAVQGKLKLDWSGGFFHLPMSSIGYKPDLDRPDGPFHDAPVAVSHPEFVRAETRLRLPPGFFPANIAKLVPEPVHTTLIGVEYSRTQSATPDSMTVDTSTRSLVSEVSYKDALAASGKLKALADGDVSLRLPATYKATAADLPALKDVAGSAADLVTRGNTLMESGHFEDAVPDFTKALEQEPKNVAALADRGIAYVWTRKFDLAAKDLDAAIAIEPGSAVALRGRALKAEFTGDCAGAVTGFTESLRQEPDNPFALGHRAHCENELGRQADALADVEAALKRNPKWGELRLLHIELLARAGQNDAADRAVGLFVEDNPNNQIAVWSAVANIYSRVGLSDKALKAFDHVLAAKPQASLYVAHAYYRRLSDFSGRMADLDAALKLDPKDSGALAAKADLLAARGDLSGALAVYESGIRTVPGQSPLSLGRAILLYRMGRKAEAERILAAWRKGAKTGSELNSLCWQKATAGILLTSAAQDCRDALKLSPDRGPYLDSFGMALLKLGKLDDALAAYDKAVAHGTGAASLFGRAIVYDRKGDHSRSQADASAARKLDPEIDDEFAQFYGLKLDAAPAVATAGH